MTATTVFETAKNLPADERLELAQLLLESLDEPDPSIQAAWAEEAESRLQAYEGGDLKAEPADEMLKRLRKQYGH